MSDERDDKRARGDERAEIDPDAPPSAEEIAASERLRDALSRGRAHGRAPEGSVAAPADDELDLVSSLHAAWSPEPLDARAHAEILDAMPMSEEEVALAAELRDALGGKSAAPDVVTALRSAWSPAALDDAEHRALVEKAIGDDHRKVVELPTTRRPRPMRLAVVTTTTVLALAASVVVWLTSTPTQNEAPLARTRSTQPLFDEPFKAGETSARIDRIAIARASDYRDNRFAKWGVR